MKKMLVILMALVLSACTSVPANSPQLNQRVSDGVEKLKQQHFVTLDKVYRLSIAKVNADYDKIYAKALNIFKSKNGKDPASESDYKVVSIIAAGIRENIIERLRKDNLEIKKSIEDNYDLVSGVNNEVTSYLYSATKLSEDRKETTELISKLTNIDLDLEKKFLELDNKTQKAIEEEIKK
ncbi:hypothetical protein [Pseudoalteromonas sp. OANN1]|uniref:hypothetical protein n=1 Tax=Pseudoalteromonas sp. OANN1 TaxID=2954497 RepID=UPI0020984ECE|nr:hypothetical protein [Pseudoalteromonas sp. OANN1]MCO7199437.1 hypothetical protein [Pseudoalteromonas sp. OANN1]